MADEFHSRAKFLEQEVDRALAQYKDAVPPDVYEQMRVEMREFMEVHPRMRSLLQIIAPPHVHHSETVEDRAEGEAPDEDAKRGTGSGA